MTLYALFYRSSAVAAWQCLGRDFEEADDAQDAGRTWWRKPGHYCVRSASLGYPDLRAAPTFVVDPPPPKPRLPRKYDPAAGARVYRELRGCPLSGAVIDGFHIQDLEDGEMADETLRVQVADGTDPRHAGILELVRAKLATAHGVRVHEDITGDVLTVTVHGERSRDKPALPRDKPALPADLAAAVDRLFDPATLPTPTAAKLQEVVAAYRAKVDDLQARVAEMAERLGVGQPAAGPATSEPLWKPVDRPVDPKSFTLSYPTVNPPPPAATPPAPPPARPATPTASITIEDDGWLDVSVKTAAGPVSAKLDVMRANNVFAEMSREHPTARENEDEAVQLGRKWCEWLAGQGLTGLTVNGGFGVAKAVIARMNAWNQQDAESRAVTAGDTPQMTAPNAE